MDTQPPFFSGQMDTQTQVGQQNTLSLHVAVSSTDEETLPELEDVRGALEAFTPFKRNILPFDSFNEKVHYIPPVPLASMRDAHTWHGPISVPLKTIYPNSFDAASKRMKDVESTLPCSLVISFDDPSEIYVERASLTSTLDIPTHHKTRLHRSVLQNGGLAAQIAASAGRPVVQPVSMGFFAGANHIDCFFPTYHPINQAEFTHGGWDVNKKQELAGQVLFGMYGAGAAMKHGSIIDTPPIIHGALGLNVIQQAKGNGKSNYRVTGFAPQARLISRELYPSQLVDVNVPSTDSMQETAGSSVLWHDQVRNSDYYRIGDGGEVHDLFQFYGTGYDVDMRSLLSQVDGVVDPRQVTVATAVQILKQIRPITSASSHPDERVEKLSLDSILLGTKTKIHFKNALLAERNVHDIGFANEISMLSRLRGERSIMGALGFITSHVSGFIVLPGNRYRKFVFPKEPANDAVVIKERAQRVSELWEAAQCIRGLTGPFAGAPELTRNRTEFRMEIEGHEDDLFGMEEEHGTEHVDGIQYFHGGILPGNIYWDLSLNRVVLGGLASVGAFDHHSPKSIKLLYLNDNFAMRDTSYCSPYLFDAILDQTHLESYDDPDARRWLMNSDLYSVGCFALHLFYGENWSKEKPRFIRNTQIPPNEQNVFLWHATSVIREVLPIPQRLDVQRYT